MNSIRPSASSPRAPAGRAGAAPRPVIATTRSTSRSSAEGQGEHAHAAQRIRPRLLLAGDQDHDGEDEEHHDGAGVDDDLGEGQELRAERQIEGGDRWPG